MKVINWDLMVHPMNWVVLFLMVFIASIGIHFILSSFVQPNQATN